VLIDFSLFALLIAVISPIWIAVSVVRNDYSAAVALAIGMTFAIATCIASFRQKRPSLFWLAHGIAFLSCALAGALSA
jgi:hypothetical protein